MRERKESNVLKLRNPVEVFGRDAVPADPVPAYNISGTRISVLLVIRFDAQKLDIACHLRPYTPDRIIELFRDREICFVGAKDEPGATDIERMNVESDLTFFDEHQIAVEYQNEDLTAEQLNGLDAKFNIRINAINRGVLAVASADDLKPVGLDVPSIDRLISDSPVVRQYIYLAADDGREYRIDFTHTFRQPLAQDGLAYQRTQKIRTIEGGAQKLITKYKDLRKIYDDMIVGVDGFVMGVNGETLCASVNKKEWVGGIPFVLKRHAIQSLFRDAERKNV